MNADRLLAYYEKIADAPDTIPRLRRFILDLAVRGKLVEQDTSDEPAATFLAEGKRCKLQECRAADTPGWLVAPVGALLEFRYGKGMKASERLKEGPVPVFGSNGIVGYCETPLTEVPSIIVGRKGSAGALNLCNGPSWTTDVAYFVQAPSFFNLRYLLIALQVLDLGSLGKGVKPGLSRSDAYDLALCVPPLAEQHRIVANVDELMALCDRLEEARTGRETTRDLLTTTSLGRLNAPDPDPVVFQNHAAFALDNLAPLTTRPDQIKALCQTILNLAVRGKLVEQDPNDEPATELLERREIAVSRAGPFELPASWAWVNVGAVAVARLGKMLDKGKNKGTPRRYLRNINVRWFDFDLSDLLEMRFEDSELPEFTLRFGDVLICEGGEPGRAAVWDGREDDIYFQKAIHRVRFLNIVDSSFFVKALRTSAYDGRLAEYFTGTGIKHFTGKGLAAYLFPLPPLPEQHRIVAKVDELMAMCDRLEATLSTGDDTRRLLLDALLHEVLVMSPDRKSVA